MSRQVHLMLGGGAPVRGEVAALLARHRRSRCLEVEVAALIDVLLV